MATGACGLDSDGVGAADAHLSSRHPEFSAGAAGAVLRAWAHGSRDCAACWAAGGWLACKARGHPEPGDPAGACAPRWGCSECVKTRCEEQV